MECREGHTPELYLSAGCGGRAILKGIAGSSLKERLFIRNDKALQAQNYQRSLMNHLIFFASAEGMEGTLAELKALFPLEASFRNPKTGGAECLQVFLDERQEQQEGNPQVLLEIHKKPYRIPIRLEIMPYQGQGGYPQEEILIEEGEAKQEAIAYCKFSSEEYLARSFYEVIDALEWLDDLLWYQEIYDILAKRAVNGRKVWECLHGLLLERPISFLRNRLNRVKGYADYSPMEERWKALHANDMEGYPQWQEVIQLLGEFYTPVFEGILKDEIFFGDWMPRLKRYLD